MPDPAVKAVSRSAVVTASAHEIFDLLTDVRRHHELDGSGSVKGAISGPERLSEGAKFSMRMRLGVPYPTRNTVVEFEPDRLIAWRHYGRHVWRYELRELPAEGDIPRTEVTETFDWTHALSPAALEKVGFPSKNAESIEKTLARLQERFARS